MATRRSIKNGFTSKSKQVTESYGFRDVKENKKVGLLGAKGVTKKENAHKGYSYKTSTSLIENVIAKKDLTLFSEMEIDGKLAITSSSQEYVNGRTRKRVNLTPIQMKLVTAFAQVIDTLLEKDGTKDYVKKLPYEIEDRATGQRGRNSKLPNLISTIVDIPELTKLMYSSSRVGGKQTNKVREEIKKLSEIKQVSKFKDDRGGTFTMKAPLIHLGKEFEYETKDGVVKFNQVEISFEDVFVYEINDRYSLSPITLLQLWNDTGVQTELFAMLLFLLQSVRGNYIIHSQKKVGEKRKELMKQGKDKEEIKEQLAALRKSTLTYKEGITSILERIDSKKYYVNGKYIHRAKIDIDLKQATDALIKMGIITEYYKTLGSSGDTVCNFVINENWLKDEATRIKKLLPPEEAENIQEEEAESPTGEE